MGKRTVWARIEEVLIERKMVATQEAGAALIGARQESAAQWNIPGRYPSMKNAVKLAERLGVCVQWLLVEEGPKRAAPKNDPYIDELMVHWPQLQDVDKRDLVGFARVRAEKDSSAGAEAETITNRNLG